MYKVFCLKAVVYVISSGCVDNTYQINQLSFCHSIVIVYVPTPIEDHKNEYLSTGDLISFEFIYNTHNMCHSDDIKKILKLECPQLIFI